MSGDLNPDSGKRDFSHRSWARKFRVSLHGLALGIRGRPGQVGLNSFAVHLPVAVAVVLIGLAMRIGGLSMGLLLLCIGLVLVAELFNTALEALSRAITEQPNPHVKTALDVSSGAVLMACLMASVVGLIVFGLRVAQLIGG